MNRGIVCLITVLLFLVLVSQFIIHQEFSEKEAIVSECMCYKCAETNNAPKTPCTHKWRSGCVYGSGCLVVHQRKMQTCEICNTERDLPEDSVGSLTNLKVRVTKAFEVYTTADLKDAKRDRPASDGWERGEFVTLRRVYPHKMCGGQLVFNGQAERAPYSDKDFFCTHVCDNCGQTNQILNAQWPQYKQEWRGL